MKATVTKMPQYQEVMKTPPKIRSWLSRIPFSPPGPSSMNQRVPDRDVDYDDYVGRNQVSGMDRDDTDWTDETKTLISPPPIFGTLSDFYVDEDTIKGKKAPETDNDDLFTWADETSTLIPPTVDYGALSDFYVDDKVAQNEKSSEIDSGDWEDETSTTTSPTQTVGAPYDFYVNYDSIRNSLRTGRNSSDWPDETSPVSSISPSEIFKPFSSENLNDDSPPLDSPTPKLPRVFLDFYRDYLACFGELREGVQQVPFYEDENN